MVRRLTAVAGLVAFLVLLAAPVAAACPWTAEKTHGCCAEPVAEPVAETGGCCGDNAVESPSPAPLPENGCNCVHAPAAPAGVVVGTPTLGADFDAEEHCDQQTVLAHITLGHSDDGQVLADRGHPPPLFLLACAFLT